MLVKSTSIHHSTSLTKFLGRFIRHLVAIIKFTFSTSPENMIYYFHDLQMQKIDMFPELYHIQPQQHKKKPAINAPPCDSNIPELVMELCSNGLYPVIDTAQML